MTNICPTCGQDTLNLATESVISIQEPLDFSGIRFRNRNATTGITIHCSATPPSHRWGAKEVDRMHRANGWLSIGYHFIITRSGIIEAGRPMDARGAHASRGGRNDTHVSICVIGGVASGPIPHTPGSPWNGSGAECNFTKAQQRALPQLLDHLKETYGLTDGDIEGHRDIPGETKACPSFNVQKWIKTGVMALD